MMKAGFLRKYLIPHYARLITSPAFNHLQRRISEVRRQAQRRRHEIYFFHDLSDPYSFLLARALPDLVATYDVALTQYLVPPPDLDTTPQAALLAAYAALDANHIAAAHGFEFSVGEMAKERQFLSGPDLTEKFHEGSAQLARLGHYQGGMLFYGGEWYWGLDRLPYLEERLRSLGAARNPEEGVRFGWPEQRQPALTADGPGRSVEMFFSFRSPYSYLALEKMPRLIERTGIDLRLRPVMPMITRGVPLSSQKGRYILSDSTREARRQGIPFGKISDPIIGEGFKNALALFPLAQSMGKALGFSRAAMRRAFAEGLYLSDHDILERLAGEVGLDWSECLEALGGEGWRGAAEENAAALSSLGLWGVPSFQCGNDCIWGQDRMWLLERLICAGDIKGPSSSDR